jgi:hypothetical protein
MRFLQQRLFEFCITKHSFPLQIPAVSQKHLKADQCPGKSTAALLNLMCQSINQIKLITVLAFN